MSEKKLKESLRKTEQALSLLRTLDERMELHLAFCILYIFQKELAGEKVSVQEIADHLGISTAAAGRNIVRCTKEGPANKGGFGLLTYLPDPENRRHRIIELTQAGKRFMRQLGEI